MIWEEEEDGDDEILAEALDRLELQLGGGGGGGAREAIDFELIPYTDRRARRFGVHRRVYTTRLSQPLNATVNRGNIAQRLENGLRCAVLQRVLNGEESDDDFFVCEHVIQSFASCLSIPLHIRGRMAQERRAGAKNVWHDVAHFEFQSTI